MKKTTRVLVALLALTLVTSCFVGGTFAKYVISDTADDLARVAKFGATITIADNTMFKQSYAVEDGTADASITNSVETSAADNVVAPGTAGELTSVVLGGTSEVAVRVSNAAALTLTGWEVDGAYYCPLTITVGTDAISGLDYPTAAAFEEAVEAKIVAYTKDYAPNVALDAAAAPVVSWAWAFVGADNGNAADGQNDVKDTKLGQAGTATIDLDVTTTITQID